MDFGSDWHLVPTRVLPFIVLLVSWYALHYETIRHGQFTLWSVFTLLSFLPVPLSILAWSYQPVFQNRLYQDFTTVLMPSMIVSAVAAAIACAWLSAWNSRSPWSMWLGGFWTGSIVGAAIAGSLQFYFFGIKRYWGWDAMIPGFVSIVVPPFLSGAAAYQLVIRGRYIQSRLGWANSTAARRNVLVLLWVCSVLLVFAYSTVRLPSKAYIAAQQAQHQANLRWEPLGWSVTANGEGLSFVCHPGCHFDLTTVARLKAEYPPVNRLVLSNATVTDIMAVDLSKIESLQEIYLQHTSISDNGWKILKSKPRLRIKKRD